MKTEILYQCKLCQKLFTDAEMSDEHYPAHCVGNDDIVQLDLVKLLDSFVETDSSLKKALKKGIEKGENPQNIADYYFDKHLTKSIYPKGRTARTLCQKCNTFLGDYDKAYLKFYNADGNSEIVKGFQKSTKLKIIKSIFAKFLSIPETDCANFDFINFLRDKDAENYDGIWKIYFVKRNYTTDILGYQDISTGKMNWDESKIVYELSDDKFIYNLLNFEKHKEFEMTNLFDILNRKYQIIEGCNDPSGGYHGQMMLLRLLKNH